MSDYGKGAGQSSKDDSEMVLPGSPDARKSGRSSYGRKVSVTTAPNSGIQGGQDYGTRNQTQDASSRMSTGSKSYRSSYGGPAGNPTDNSVGKYDEYDYGKGTRKKGAQRKRVKAQGK